jgi:hypothetical protein
MKDDVTKGADGYFVKGKGQKLRNLENNHK